MVGTGSADFAEWATKWMFRLNPEKALSTMSSDAPVVGSPVHVGLVQLVGGLITIRTVTGNDRQDEGCGDESYQDA
jgi:hypothetical protein